MGDREIVQPSYASAGWESSNPFLGGYNETQAEYPLRLGPHRVQVEYGFEEKETGWKIVHLRYFCKRCDAESFIEHGRLYEKRSEHMATARAYMLGSIIERDCV